MSASTRTGWLWIAPWLVGFGLFLALPLGLSLYYSLTDYSLLEPPIFLGLDNYRELLGDDLFWITVRNTAVYAVAYVVLGNALAIGLAVLLARPSPLATLGRMTVFLPTIVPLVAVALGWMWMYNTESGIINRLLGLVGIAGPHWLGERPWAMAALILMGLWSVGGAFVIYLAAVRDVPRALYEASSLDGVGAAGRLRHITLPMISPAILFNVIVGVIWSVQMFAAPYMMTRGGPEDSTRFYTMYVYENGFVHGRMGYASALAWVQFAVILVLTLIVIRGSRRLVFYQADPA